LEGDGGHGRNPGNAPDTRYATPGYGSLNYTYNIGKYEVTAGQHTAFLNAVAKTDTYGLYNANMWNDTKIQQSGTSGSLTYSVASDYANRPVNYVCFWDACRFCNWLHNGQPEFPAETSGEVVGSTETGAYALASDGMTNNTIVRNAGARGGTGVSEQ
jgi:formylglycine-generating enzyme